ncbi:hypothetical protein ASD39_07450 [Sphingomonas sp. Root50]|nr:hypothetical protein ASD17_05675 [Sphingomonas sp. Root1294]KQY67753.1 hypothetical protein ASD39_07450 [Sphingomonas sp. Root50]
MDSAGTTAEAFRDWQTYTIATKGKLGLYHANIDPDAKYQMTPAQWTRAVDILEEELGLQGQPRAVVMHEKHGRQHIHVVWSRADMETMTLRSDSQNFQAHERASLRMEQEFGHEIVPGKHAKRDRENQPEFPTADVSHDEWQQAERSGLGHRERKAQVTALFEASDSGTAFKAALEDAGYVLARGDRRDFVLLDSDAKVHSLGRQLPGLKAKELRAFMADINQDSLPTVDQARADIRSLARTEQETPSHQPDPQPEPKPPADNRVEELRSALGERYAQEQHELFARHNAEVTSLQEANYATTVKAIGEFARERAKQAAADRAENDTAIRRTMRSIKESVSRGSRRERLDEAAKRRDEAEVEREAQARIMLSGIEAQHGQQMNALIERQAQELADLRAEHARDLAQRLKDLERAKEIEREYERRRQEALDRQRDGPDRAR